MNQLRIQNGKASILPSYLGTVLKTKFKSVRNFVWDVNGIITFAVKLKEFVDNSKIIKATAQSRENHKDSGN